MLARPDTFRCIECHLPFTGPGFAYIHGDIAEGAAYWSDRGVLCGPKCSLAHVARRRAEGTMPQLPTPNPMTGRIG